MSYHPSTPHKSSEAPPRFYQKISISLLLVAFILLLTMGLLGSVGFHGYFLYAQKENAEFESLGRYLAEDLGLALTNPIRTSNQEQIQAMVRIQLKKEHLCSAMVFGVIVWETESNSAILTLYKDSNNIISATPPEHRPLIIKNHSHNIVVSNKSLGRVELLMNRDLLETDLKNIRLALYAIIPLFGIISALSIYMLLFRVVIQPLQQLNIFAQRITKDDSEKTKSFNTPLLGELNNLRITINQLLELLQSRYNQLKIREERLQLATCSANIGIWDWDITKDELTWDDSMYKLHQQKKDDFEGAYLAWTRTLHPEDKILAGEAIRTALRGQKEYALEYRIIWPDGSIRHIKSSAQTIRDNDGQALRMVGVNIDITNLKNAENSLQASLQRYQNIITYSPMGMLMYELSPNDQLIFVGSNPATDRILGTNTSLLFGKTLEEAFPGLQQTDIPQKYREIASQGKTNHEEQMYYSDGVVQGCYEYWVFQTEPGKIVVQYNDITARKKVELELDQHRSNLEHLVKERTTELLLARDAANEANRSKSLFLTHMSHELRTPMNAVLGFAQLLRRDSTISDQNQDYVDTILKSGKHLLNMINNILEMSRIDAGRLVLKPELIDIHSLLEELFAMFRWQAAEQKLLFTLNIHPNLPRQCRVDEEKVRRVLINLLGNALKFTSSGSITVCAFPMKTTHLAIEVQDSGIGIEPDELERLFKPFERTTQGERMAGGTGLGLAISRELAHLLGGEISVTSQVGKGSCFRFDFAVDWPEPTNLLLSGTEPTTTLVTPVVQQTYKLDKMSSSWRASFRQALDQGDVAQLVALGKEALCKDPWLSEHILRLASDYDLDALRGLLA